jgi:hypothetical protein
MVVKCIFSLVEKGAALILAANTVRQGPLKANNENQQAEQITHTNCVQL